MKGEDHGFSGDFRSGYRRCCAVHSAPRFTGGSVIARPESPLEVYFADPEAVPAPISIVGVFPAGAGIADLEAAAEAYRVYLGTPPWTVHHIAPFRLGPDEFAVTPDDGEYANELRVTTPAFSPPGWLDLEIVDLNNLRNAAMLYDAVQVMSLQEEEPQEENGGEGEGEIPDEEEGEGESGAFDSANVWVDFAYTGIEIGSESQPFNSLAEGVEAVDAGGVVNIVSGISDEIPTLSKPVTLISHNGTTQIGNPAGSHGGGEGEGEGSEGEGEGSEGEGEGSEGEGEGSEGEGECGRCAETVVVKVPASLQAPLLGLPAPPTGLVQINFKNDSPVAFGAKITVNAQASAAPGYKFMRWDAPHTPIHGSREQSETFVLGLDWDEVENAPEWTGKLLLTPVYEMGWLELPIFLDQYSYSITSSPESFLAFVEGPYGDPVWARVAVGPPMSDVTLTASAQNGYSVTGWSVGLRVAQQPTVKVHLGSGNAGYARAAEHMVQLVIFN